MFVKSITNLIYSWFSESKPPSDPITSSSDFQEEQVIPLQKENEDDNIRNEIIKLINECCYFVAVMDKSSDSKLKELAKALKVFFDSEYCAIGKVDENFVEDCVVSYYNANNENECRIQERSLKDVKRVSIDNPNNHVCKALKSNQTTYYCNGDNVHEADNFEKYKSSIIRSQIKDTTVIIIRDNNNVNHGYVQLINSVKKVEHDDFAPFLDELLKLILIIKRSDASKDAILFKQDFDFISRVQGKIDKVDSLLDEIMRYLSEQFSAGIISYRIPLLVGFERKPLFFLRDCYIRNDVAAYYSRNEYFRERLVRNEAQMGGHEKLSCDNIDSIILDKAKDSDYYKKITDDKISFHKDTLIIPILRDYSGRDECLHPERSGEKSACGMESNCPYRFSKYFGVFRLRISKNPCTQDSDEPSEWLSEETKGRLSHLAQHISILLNSIVDKCENDSLDTFRKELKGTSFTKIKEFDEQYSKIVKDAIHTKICAIYRYDAMNENRLTLSASTSPNISSTFMEKDFNDTLKRYRDEFSISESDKLEEKLFDGKCPIYYTSGKNDLSNSIMLVPLIRKDDTKLGIMLLVGKEINNQQRTNISKTFWEHDKKHIEFFVDILTRIEESDSERLTFLSQLSHELLRPVTEIVNRNYYNITTANRNMDAYSKKMFIDELQKNVDMCMMFKYIIDDVEFIYSLSKGNVQYNFEMVDFKRVILDAVRLLEEEASFEKKLSFKTYLKKMPNMLFIDKSRMTQVVINLLKNAVHYSFRGSEITISYDYNEEAKCHEIDFRDYGIEIKKEDKEKIFDLFTRSKLAIEKRPDGSGIGLYLVKQIMNAHGGDCFVKELSSPTIFTIQIKK